MESYGISTCATNGCRLGHFCRVFCCYMALLAPIVGYGCRLGHICSGTGPKMAFWHPLVKMGASRDIWRTKPWAKRTKRHPFVAEVDISTDWSAAVCRGRLSVRFRFGGACRGCEGESLRNHGPARMNVSAVKHLWALLANSPLRRCTTYARQEVRSVSPRIWPSRLNHGCPA